MPFWTTILVIALAALAIAFRAARLRQVRVVTATISALESRACQQPVLSGTIQSMADLPPPVKRYLDHVLPPGHHDPGMVRYRQAGVLRTDPRRDNWMAFSAVQAVSPGTTEFLWVARVSIAPMLHIQVRDSYLDGTGAGEVLLLSALPVASAAGNMEMNSGALHRFLAEAVWYPSSLLPSAHLSWAPLDEHRATATLSDGTTTVSLEFRFNSANEVASIHTPGRWGSFGGTYKQVPWEGKFHRYARRHGVLVPGEGEVAWFIDGEWRPVWRGEIVDGDQATAIGPPS